MSRTDLNVSLLDQALKLALRIADDMTRVEMLEGLAVAYAEAGQTAWATTIFRRIWQIARRQSNASDRQWQLRCAAEACVEANLEELAVTIAADLVQASDRASISVELAKHHVKASRLSPATAYLAEALAWVRRAEEAGEGTSFTRRAIAETAVDLGLIEHAVQVASALDHHQFAVRALCAVAVRCAQTWQHGWVAAIFEQALQRVSALPGEANQARSLVDLVTSRAQAGLLDHAPVQRAVATLPEPEARARVWLTIAASAAACNDREGTLVAADQAWSAAKTMPEAAAAAKILATGAERYQQAGEPERAAEVRRLAQSQAEAIEPASTRVEALEAIAICHATVGESETAERLVDQTVAALEPEHQAFHHVLTRLAVAEACRHVGQSALAHTWLRHVLARATQIADIDRRTQLLEGLADTACDLGDYDLALRAAHGMGPGHVKRLNPQAFHLAVIAGALAKHGDWKRALQVAETISEGAAKTSAFDDIATASIAAGRDQEALQTVQRIGPPDDRAWGMVWALIRISRLRREGSP